jgi:hypothetical protein
MEESLADLKRIKPKSDDGKDTIHFSENKNAEKEEDSSVCLRYHAYLRHPDHAVHFGIMDVHRDEAPDFEVVIEDGRTLFHTEVVAPVLWELTWDGAKAAENEDFRRNKYGKPDAEEDKATEDGDSD